MKKGDYIQIVDTEPTNFHLRANVGTDNTQRWINELLGTNQFKHHINLIPELDDTLLILADNHENLPTKQLKLSTHWIIACNLHNNVVYVLRTVCANVVNPIPQRAKVTLDDI